jgi:hypothetical protein
MQLAGGELLQPSAVAATKEPAPALRCQWRAVAIQGVLGAVTQTPADRPSGAGVERRVRKSGSRPQERGSGVKDAAAGVGCKRSSRWRMETQVTLEG